MRIFAVAILGVFLAPGFGDSLSDTDTVSQQSTSMSCWAIGNPETGMRPSPMVTSESHTTHLSDFESLCTGMNSAGTEAPIEQVLCIYSGITAPPLFEGRTLETAPEYDMPGYGGSSQGYDFTDTICGANR